MNWMRTDLGRSNRQRTLHANRCKRSHISFVNLALRTAADVASHLSTDLSVEAAQRTVCAPLRISNQPPTAAAMRQLESSSSQQAACRSNRPIGGQGSSLVPRSNTVTKWTLDSGYPELPISLVPRPFPPPVFDRMQGLGTSKVGCSFVSFRIAPLFDC